MSAPVPPKGETIKSPQELMAHIDSTFAQVQSGTLAALGPIMSEAMAPVKALLIQSIAEAMRVRKLAMDAGVDIPPPADPSAPPP